jgi:hypothetical protein
MHAPPCLLLCITLTGCVHGASGRPVGGETPHVPGIRIIRADQAAALKVQGQPLEFPFGDRQDGTKLVLDFLEEAKRAGARYVSDIRIELRTARDGRSLDCVTELLPISQPGSEVVPHEQPGRVETRTVMRPVTQTVTEYTYQCRMTMQPVTRMETSYQYQYDYASRTSRSVPVTRMVTSYQSRNDCSMVPVTRTVTRYEHQIETRFIPPSLVYLRTHYSDFDMVESKPRCRPAQALQAGARLSHRIVGIMYKERP